MDRRDWLLGLISLPADTEEVARPLDPIRIMKSMFLFTQEGGLNTVEAYEFEPYYYGPCSFAIYDDLEELLKEGLIQKQAVPGQTWNVYLPTVKGSDRANVLAQQASPYLLDRLRQTKKMVVSLPFLGLLREVYKRYPEYAKKSVIKV